MINELRIGNWIYFVSVVMDEQYRVLKPGENPYVRKNPVRVQVSTFDKIEKSPENFAPIPLSTDILEACGFEREDLGNDPPYEWWTHKENERFEVWNFNEEHWILDMADQYGIPQDHFKYLHQLQNLFFALTGTELTINLEKVKV